MADHPRLHLAGISKRFGVVRALEGVSLTVRPGWLRLFAQPSVHNDLARTANLLLQKFPARAFAVETQLEFSSARDGDEAGIVITGNKHAALALRSNGRETQVVFWIGSHEQIVGTFPGVKARLRVKVDDGGACVFSLISDEGKELAAREEFQACAGKWIGARIGLYCRSQTKSGGFADFDYFRFAPPA